ncbi:MAG: PAS domain-containing sensor histidine kinase [Planctomycetota bacterium]|nr:MAG: PAS domain-containing sensor histidine kinase [Planctomycetota bacterium]
MPHEAAGDARDPGESARRTSPSAEDLRRVLDALPLRVFWKDLEGRYLGCNAAFARDAGKACPADVLGCDDFALAWSEQAERYRADDAEVVASGQSKLAYEEPQTTPTGERIWLRTSKVPLRDEEGAICGVLGVYEEITEQRAQRLQSTDRERFEALGRMAGGVAHEFNNMLTVILGSLDLLDRNVGAAARREAVLATREAAERVRLLTRQLLAFSRRQVLRPRTVDINEVLRESLLLLERTLGEHIQIRMELSAEPCTVRIDPSQLQQVLVHLASHGRDSMSGGGTLTLATAISPPAVPSRGGDGGRTVELRLSDTGPGLDREAARRLFEPFADASAIGRGAGLSLATCWGIVEQHGGRLSVESGSGPGTTFLLRFPWREPAGNSDASAEATGAGGTAAGRRVLVVEDEPLLRRAARMALEERGYRVLLAEGRREALELSAASEEAIAAVVCDVVLGDGRGPEVVRALRAQRPGLRALYVSGYTDVALGSGEGEALGDAFLGKPYTFTELGDAVDRLLADPPEPDAPSA